MFGFQPLLNFHKNRLLI